MIELYLIVILLAMLPVVEALGSVAVGILIFHLDPVAVFLLAFTFNSLVYFPIRWFLDNFYGYFKRFKIVKRLVENAHHKGHKQVEKYGYFGLTVFLALPIPFSGAWTGTLIAWLLNLDRRKAFFAVMIGVFTASLTATLLAIYIPELLRQLSGLA
jgi:uncharacterized membrane protein